MRHENYGKFKSRVHKHHFNITQLICFCDVWAALARQQKS